MKFIRFFARWLILLPVMLWSCALLSEDAAKKKAPQGLITTPASYYSTTRGRYLGGKYKENLDRLVEQIVRNPKTANLQFANNIAALGGIGFFTHSETKTPDERYLEVIVGAPETFEWKSDQSAKILKIFSLYGLDLLSILVNDTEIYQEKEVSGYGLNFSWRNIAQQASGPRIVLERAVVYFPKEKVKSFLAQGISQNSFLGESVMFAVEEDGPMNLLSFRAQVPKSDSRPPILEESLAGAEPAPSNPGASAGQPATPANRREAALESTPMPEVKKSNETGAPKLARPEGRREEVPKATPMLVVEEKRGESARGVATTDLALATKPSTAPRLEQIQRQEAAIEIEPQEATGPVPALPVSEAEKKPPDSMTPPQSLPSQVAAITLTEQIALLPSKPSESIRENKPAPRPLAKVLEGFVIQVAFSDKNAVQRWAETLERRGYAVSVTEAGGTEAFRLRIGNFAVRDEAERQLRTLRQEGLTGIVVNLPQAYRPESRRSAPEEKSKAAATAQ